MSEPRNYIELLRGQGSEAALRFLENPIKENLAAIGEVYKLIDTGGKYEEFVQDEIARMTIGYCLDVIREQLQAKTIDESEAVHPVRGLLETAKQETGDKRWLIPKGVADTYSEIEVIFRTRLGLSIPDRLDETHDRLRLEDLVTPPPEMPA